MLIRLLNRHWNQFQHTAARRRLVRKTKIRAVRQMFQHTAARRRLVMSAFIVFGSLRFQHTAARRRLESGTTGGSGQSGFNTQPPEGGWYGQEDLESNYTAFQHTAARRRLGFTNATASKAEGVSTHSRPKAAGSPVSNL